MSGSREKQRRRESGISIKARRAEAEFTRAIEHAYERRATKTVDGMRSRRVALAWAGIAVIVASIAAAFFL